jgi:hypothetical protein
MKTKELTNAVFARLQKKIEKKARSESRFHEMEWDCTGNRHASNCWCITETYKLAKELGYK